MFLRHISQQLLISLLPLLILCLCLQQREIRHVCIIQHTSLEIKDHLVSGLVTFTVCRGASPGASGSRWFLQGPLRQRRGAGGRQDPGLREHLHSPGAQALTHRPPFPSRSWDARQPLECSLVLCLRFEGWRLILSAHRCVTQLTFLMVWSKRATSRASLRAVWALLSYLWPLAYLLED